MGTTLPGIFQVGTGIYFVNTRKKNRVMGMGMGMYGYLSEHWPSQTTKAAAIF